MKKLRFLTLIFAFVILCFSDMSVFASMVPEPQYSTNDDSAGRTYTGYFAEDGILKSTYIIIKRHRLRSYWNGVAWVNGSSKIEKNDMSKNIKDDDPEEIKFLSKLPSYVIIEKKKVYFDPQEN